MTQADEAGSNGRGAGSPALNAFCRFVDRLNESVGWLLGPMIVFVSAAIVYEVVSRGAFNEATTWVNESVVYGSSAVYVQKRVSLSMSSTSGPRIRERVPLPRLRKMCICHSRSCASAYPAP